MNRRNFLAITAAAASTSRARAGTADVPLLSFGLTTDVQYADADPEGERHYRESIPKLKAAVEDLAKEKLPFTLHLGDMIDRDYSSFATILPLFTPLGHPVRHLPGNHDYTVTESDKAKIIQTLGMPSDYYAFRSSGVKFLMLDTNDVSTYKHPEGSPADVEAEAALKQLAASGAKNAKPWNGGLSPKQLAWLEKELTEADAAKEATIVCGHHPMVSEDGLHAWNDQEIITCIKRHPSVRAYFCGHNHAGGEVISDGVPFITFKSILHEPGITSYAVIRLFADRFLIEGRGREKTREIKLRA